MALNNQEKQSIRDLLNREPTDCEWHIFDTMWSEHCSYKSSKRVLKTLPTKGSEVVLGIGEDAGVIHFAEHDGKTYGLAVAHESHNHPSQILPVEGSATGVGGVVRDVYCMGADVIGVLNSLHFGLNTDGKTPIVDEIAEKVVFGVSDYGNPLGVPVLGGETVYHESYNDNCLVNVAAVGLVETDQIIHSYVPKKAADEPYVLILIGKSTDATGFGGATFSSATLDADNDTENIGAVQVHDPFLKRVLVEAIKAVLADVKETGVEIGFKDLGAGGIACAGSEMAAAGGFGVTINLDQVNTAFDHLNSEVIACSETQERYCMAVPQHYAERVLKIVNEDFECGEIYRYAGAVVIGEVITEQRFRMSHKGEPVCNLPVEAITTEVRADRASEPREFKTQEVTVDFSLEKIQTLCESMIGSENNRSKYHVYRHFDNAVRGDTVVYPGEADAVVVTPVDGCDAGVAVSMDSNMYGAVDPYISGAYAVAESVRNVISVGARPIALTDCLNYGNPEKPSVFYDFEKGIEGIGDAANALSFIPKEPIPIISGNVSFYNESKSGNAVVPSPVILCVGKLDSYFDARTMQVSNPEETIILIGKRYAEFGGTQFATHQTELHESSAPQVRLEDEAKQNQAVYTCIQSGWVSACHDISMGGLFQTLSEMMLGERGNVRAGLDIKNLTEKNLETFLFSENGGYVLSIPASHLDQVTETLKEFGLYYKEIGHSISEEKLNIYDEEKGELTFSTDVLTKQWATLKVS